jgi:predicted ATPase/DNA-binding CsgD family transcriptional regulator
MDTPLPHLDSQRLPAEITPFIGRQDDLARLQGLLRDPTIRLVTLTGTGGVGKTRLACEVSAALQKDYPDGVFFVSLAPLNTAADLLPAITETLGIRLPLGGDLHQAVLERLHSRQALLILDNFEHLLDGALLVHDILAAAPAVKVLATSREKLDLQGEVLYHLHGLAIPPPNAQGQAGEYDAVRLFVSRACQADPRFSLDENNAAAINQLCRLVDGIPLGILLAAAWVELFSPQEIAAQVQRDLDFLSSQSRDTLPRHRSLRAVFDSSYNRLDPVLKTVLVRLAVFRAGFTLSAAEAIAHADLRSLLALAHKSLLSRDPTTGRYHLHELLNQYITEKLSPDEYQSLRAEHSGYYLGLLSQYEAALKSASQLDALDTLQADFENIRQAWVWAVEQGDQAALQHAAKPLYALCDMRCRFYEGEALFNLAWQRLAPQAGQLPIPGLMLLLLSWIDLHGYRERLKPTDELISLATDCHEQAKLAGDPEALATSLVVLGVLAELNGDCPAAIEDYERGLRTDPGLDDFYWINLRIGLCYQRIGDYARALRAFDQSLLRGKTLGERVKIGWSLFNGGETLLLQGDLAGAEERLTQARSQFLAAGTAMGIMWCNYTLARLALASGDPLSANELAEAALQTAGQIIPTAWKDRVKELIGQIDKAKLAQSTKATRPAHTLVEPFSSRELEVLQLLKTDLSGPEIAQRLTISLNTVRYHTKNIYQKLQVCNRREAVHRAEELGW